MKNFMQGPLKKALVINISFKEGRNYAIGKGCAIIQVIFFKKYYIKKPDKLIADPVSTMYFIKLVI